MPHPLVPLPTAAQQLKGRTLPGGWRVTEWIQRQPHTTGGNFSESYLVEDSKGHQAFLKALDFSQAPFETDTVRWLDTMTKAYLHEVDLFELCGQKRLDRVVRVLGRGQELIQGNGGLPDVVPFLVLERADGDLRSQLHLSARFDLAVALRVLHQVAVGLQQLHGIRIAHQDLKPSNVVLFGKLDARLTDLGSASHQDRTAPRDDCRWAGDAKYTPPELLYGHRSPEWTVRRLGCDAYMLGAMVVYLFHGAPLTPQILIGVPAHQRPEAWTGTYTEVLPLLQAGFGAVVETIQPAFKAQEVSELVDVVRWLCEPDPTRRGHPRSLGQGGLQYDLARYVSLFDRLARRVETGFWKHA